MIEEGDIISIDIDACTINVKVSDEELEAYGRGSLYRAAVEGDEKTGCFLAGQIAGMVNKEQTAKEIIEEIFTQAEDVLKGATKWVK